LRREPRALQEHKRAQPETDAYPSYDVKSWIHDPYYVPLRSPWRHEIRLAPVSIDAHKHPLRLRRETCLSLATPVCSLSSFSLRARKLDPSIGRIQRDHEITQRGGA
jgi:hypothetical protein